MNIIRYHTKHFSFIGRCWTRKVKGLSKECKFPFTYKGQENITKCIKPIDQDEYICPTDNPKQFSIWYGINGNVDAKAGICEFGETGACGKITGIINDTALLLVYL